MRWLMRKCVNCGRYTLRQDKCPICGSEVRVPHPPRFSPEDKYVLYRLKAKYGLDKGQGEAGKG
ncbi:MAG TPA: RNA-protein complex protein Nop10 [Candidatus Bathyarchaeota archaeon]|nr:RNA-protein complex protein Nop10 [Candidatus Bathyarchaeota archaeon]